MVKPRLKRVFAPWNWTGEPEWVWDCEGWTHREAWSAYFMWIYAGGPRLRG